MRTTETKTAILKDLKEMGYNTRLVSVSVRRGGLESVVVLTIRDTEKVDVSKVKEKAESYESISRCEATGEILSGGNCFIWVVGSNGRFIN